MRGFARRHPFLLAILIVAAAVGLAALSEAAFPSAPVGNASNLTQRQLEPPTEWDQVADAVISPESLFWALAILLSAIVLSVLGWWREAGVTAPPRWSKLYLLIFPALVVALAFSGGVFMTGPGALGAAALGAAAFAAILSVLGEELIFRGVLLRALAPVGALGAVALTSLLAGTLYMGRGLLDGPWTEAIYVTVLAICGGFTYGALRWRTASLWPAFLIHVSLAFALDSATVGGAVFPILILCVTLGFVLYGLFLLRNRRVRADGGPSTNEEPARVV